MHAAITPWITADESVRLSTTSSRRVDRAYTAAHFVNPCSQIVKFQLFWYEICIPQNVDVNATIIVDSLDLPLSPPGLGGWKHRDEIKLRCTADPLDTLHDGRTGPLRTAERTAMYR